MSTVLTGYVDKVDLDCEFVDIGCTFAGDLEALYYGCTDNPRTCLKECGVYRVEIRVVEDIPGEKVAALLLDIEKAEEE
jgi:hypothetical protein